MLAMDVLSFISKILTGMGFHHGRLLFTDNTGQIEFDGFVVIIGSVASHQDIGIVLLNQIHVPLNHQPVLDDWIDAQRVARDFGTGRGTTQIVAHLQLDVCLTAANEQDTFVEVAVRVDVTEEWTR